MKTNENGRSMVEMLGVLAIIGVLSVGGIYGYTVAMRKYKANEIAQTFSMLATMAHAANAGEGGDVTLAASGLDQKPGGVDLSSVSVTATCSTGDSCKTVTIAMPDIPGDAQLKGAVCAIVPKSGTAVDRAGYQVTDCS